MTTAAIALGIYAVIAAGLLAANHRLLRDPSPDPAPEPEVVNWLPFLPPVPPSDRVWVIDLAEQPVDVWLTRELSDRLFSDLIAIEGLQ